nr:MAG TPA: hypothetical protein [Caudoviricetes sp.]
MARVINNSRELREMRGEILRKDVRGFAYVPENAPLEEGYKAYNVARLVVFFSEGEVYAHVAPTQVPASRYSPFLEGTISPEMCGGFSVERFSRAFINVRFMGDSDKWVNAESLLSGDIFYDGKTYYVETAIEGVWRDLLKKKDIPALDKDAVVVYGGASYIASNGQIKKKEVSFFASNLPGFDSRFMINALTYGLVDQLEGYEREAGTAKQVAQLSTRLAQPAAPAVEGKEVRNCAYLMGIYDTRWDGQLYVSQNFACEWVQDRLGERFYVPFKTLRGLTFQCRPHLCKGNASVVTREYMDHFLVSHEWEPVVIIRDEVTMRDQMAFNQAVWSKGKEGPFAGKVVLLVDSLEDLKKYGVEIFTDLNGLKETFDIRQKTGLNVLAMTGENEDCGRKTSTQTFATYLSANKEVAESVFMDGVEKLVGKAWNEIAESEGHAPSYVDEFEGRDRANYGQLFSSVVPGFGREIWAPLYRGTVRNALKGLDRDVSNLNVPIEGTQGFLVVDPAIDFGFKSLKFEGNTVEVFCRDIEGKEGILNRYPAANLFAFSKVVGVTADTLIERAKEAGLDDTALKLFESRIRSLADGIIVVPADELLAAKHDGWDFDGDHANIVTNEKVLEITSEFYSEVVKICEDKEEYEGFFS